VLNLNDVWRDVSERIGFFTWETHENIPAKTGIYAWFYPLRIYSKDPYEFVREINQILYYDSSTEDDPEKEVEAKFNWDKILLNIRKSYVEKDESIYIKKKWEKIKDNSEASGILKAAVMESSILLPPLYVGRANDLNERYLQHVNGGSSNDFNRRFTCFVEKKNIVCKVSDLLFVCINTENEDCDKSYSKELSDVIEGILKLLCKPIYGKK
tara:strand:- start:739 stop:1374 length:636 start_codon:yes stop_codon:yes gene_type:complete